MIYDTTQYVMLLRYTQLLEGLEVDQTRQVLTTIGNVYSLWVLHTHAATLYQGTLDTCMHVCVYSMQCRWIL